MVHNQKLIWDERLQETDKPFVLKTNELYQRLVKSRVPEIRVEGRYAQSKIAWKLGSYRQMLLYRTVALLRGLIVTWNYRCTLSAMLSGRALMETFAITYGLERRIADLLRKEALDELDALATQSMFATREDEWLDEYPESKAINALTFIDEVDRDLPGFRKHYDYLSERCHPNSLGHNFMFSILDRTNGTVRFMEERHQSHNATLILAGLAPVLVVESIFMKLDDSIGQIAELHHLKSPRGSGA